MKTVSIVLLLLLSVACAAAEDGRIYVKSEPAGAEICIFSGNDKDLFTTTNQKTPALVNAPQGEQKILLRLAGYKDTYLTVKVEGEAIIKPDPVKLVVRQVALDILYSDDGWNVLIDKKVVSDASGKPAVAPCTIPVQQGHHEVTLAKDGFNDMTTQVVVGGDLKIDIDKIGLKPSKGKGTVSVPAKEVQKDSSLKDKVVPGKYEVKYLIGTVRTYNIEENGHVTFEEENRQCDLQLAKNGDLLIDFDDNKIERVKFRDGKITVDHFDPKSKYPSGSPSTRATGVVKK